MWLQLLGVLTACATAPFRLEDFLTTIIVTERFVDAVRRLGYEPDIAFRELPVRGS